MPSQKNYIQSHKERFLAELFELLRFPSVSANPNFQKDIRKTANFVAEKLSQAGADKVEICETAGNPIVYGEKIIDIKLPTVLVYGHYDVQPPEPLELWVSPPFEPTLRDGKIYARGACDDKGQFYMHIKAFETMLQTQTLACNVKFMIEGEEEVGSDNLGAFVSASKEKLKADVVLISDTSMIGMDSPSIETGLRGLSYMEVEVQGPSKDLHSGVYGGAVANPATILCQMIASLHDKKNRVNIPGFYDGVQELSKEERAELNQAPFNLDIYKNDLQLNDVWGEEGYTTIERTGIRPTLEVNGIWSGYTGVGAKTVLPSKANAKISMRLVPGQDWQKISDLFAAHIKSIAPSCVKVKVEAHHGGAPYVTPINSIAYKAAQLAIEESFGKKPVPTRGGGSIPIVALFENVLGLKTILLGFGLDSDSLHSPNEKYDVFNFYKGIETIPLFYKHFALLSKNNL